LESRSFASVAAEVIAALKGAHIIRTHDVKAAADALRIADIASD
jgi:dihydropteroate synthase